MKQVPEGNTTVTADQQLAILREKLMGNQAFAVCRGKFDHQVSRLNTELLDSTDSPTSFLIQWDDFFGKARVMSNLLAQFKRDGLTVAQNELEKALKNKGYILPGETVSIEETQPMTVLMLDPERTILMLKWIIEGHWIDLDHYLEWRDGKMKDRGFFQNEPHERVKKLFEMFPTLEKHSRVRKARRDYEGQDLRSAYDDTVLKSFSKEVQNVLKEADGRCLKYGQFNDHIEMERHPFVYVFMAEQSEVLRIFSREEQARIATWQLDVPKLVGNNCHIGVHPEGLHEEEQINHPALTSKGCSNFLGVSVITENPVVWSDKPKPAHQYKTFAKFGENGQPYGIVFDSK